MSIFLSYSYDDNLSPDGWVVNFHKKLQLRIKVIAGEDFPIFFDRYDLKGNLLKESLKKQIQNTKILIALVSPSYLNKYWCTVERRLFLLYKRQNIKKPEERIFIAIKLVDENFRDISQDFVRTLPKELRQQRYFKFFKLDANNNPAELEDESSLKEAINDLARKIVAYSKEINNQDHSHKPKGIYVAETNRDVGRNRQKLIQELESFGYKVYPTEQLPESPEDINARIKFYLSKSSVSINLIGENYGLVFSGSNKSLPQIQYEQARDIGVPTLFWMENQSNIKDVQQKNFVDVINQNLSHPSDLLSGSFEDFKLELSEKLDEIF